jgi:phosphoribosyl 1,2-cyclic phosphodiesterase
MDQLKDLQLKVWGVRGSSPTPVRGNLGYGGNTPCLEIRAMENQVAIFDAGTGIRNLGEALLVEFEGRPPRLDVFLTHYHWDHIQGLPFFRPLYQEGLEITFHAAGRLGPLHSRLRGQMQAPYFPVDFDSIPARVRFVELEEGSPHQVGGLRVVPFPMNHPQGAAGYRIEGPQGVIVYASDLEPGDAKLDRAVREASEGAHTLVYDAQFTPEEYVSHKGWGHSHWREAAAVARDAHVHQLVLFHHDPFHDDQAMARIEADTQRLFENAVAAREGGPPNIGAQTKGQYPSPSARTLPAN